VHLWEVQLQLERVSLVQFPWGLQLLVQGWIQQGQLGLVQEQLVSPKKMSNTKFFYCFLFSFFSRNLGKGRFD
jgi:hypothetical protein